MELGLKFPRVLSSRSQHSQHYYRIHRCVLYSSLSSHQTDMTVIDSFKANATSVDVRVLTSLMLARGLLLIFRAVVPMAC